MTILGYRYRSFALGGKLVWSLEPPGRGAYDIARFVQIDGQVIEEELSNADPDRGEPIFLT